MSTLGGTESVKYVDDLDNYFELLWRDELENLEVRGLPDTPREILIKESRGHRLEELVEDLKKVRSISQKAPSHAGRSISKPKVLMAHQTQVLDSWERANYLGIIDHVTGSGKTISAISAIKNWIMQDRPALVIVPSSLLQKQWAAEIRREIG